MSTEISSDLFLAILSMDSFNRGYDAGIALNGSAIGNAIIETDSEEAFYEEGQAPGALSSAAAAGFYAVAYQWNGDTVISYRGTDNDSILGNPWTSPSDVYNGWPLGGGDYTASQAQLATNFLAATTNQVTSGSVVLTGHSLGGGLAGFTAEVTGASGAIATAA